MGDEELSAPPNGGADDMKAEQKSYELNALQIVGDWSVHDDGDGRLFYYDRKTDASQWEVPNDLAALETEFMMKLMLQNAVARSGAWTAHDTGNGTLYYFNSKTRASVWERPGEWGEAEAATVEAEPARIDADQQKEKEDAAVTETNGNKKPKKHKKRKEKRGEGVEQKQLEARVEEEVEEEVPLTEEELLAEEERKAREQKRIEQFRAMLRDKNIMPLTKWSVALPLIAGDPRFMGVPTMDERRTIFEHFVAHRREDLKAEKKSKLKQAKKQFTELLREQFQIDSWELSTTLSVFLSTLEDHVEAERYKQIQDDVLALLTLSAQEKIYAKAVADFKSEALKRDGQQLRLTKFLEEKLSSQDKTTMEWESDEVQQLVRGFYSSSGELAALLSEPQQRQVFEELVLRLTRSTRDEGDRKQSERSDSLHRSPSQSSERKRQGSSPRELSHSHHDHRRSRSHRRRRSRSDSCERSHRSRRSSRRRSEFSSRSRSRSRSRKSSRHRSHRSSSSSRSRSRARR